MYTLFTSFLIYLVFFFFSSRRRHTSCLSDWISDVCSSDLGSLQKVGRVMADHEEDSTGCQGGCGMRQRPAALLGGKVKVHDHNEVERGCRRPPLDDIGLDPGHFHATVGRQSLCLGKPIAREVDAR